jgi:hypothetical protein
VCTLIPWPTLEEIKLRPRKPHFGRLGEIWRRLSISSFENLPRISDYSSNRNTSDVELRADCEDIRRFCSKQTIIDVCSWFLVVTAHFQDVLVL